MDGYNNNPEKSSTTKLDERTEVFQCLQYHHLEM